MGRSLKKGPYVDLKLLKKVMREKEGGSAGRPLRTWARTCTIIPDFVGHRFEIHNGRSFNAILVTEEMVGHKLGEFAPTRVWRGHAGSERKG